MVANGIAPVPALRATRRRASDTLNAIVCIKHDLAMLPHRNARMQFGVAFARGFRVGSARIKDPYRVVSRRSDEPSPFAGREPAVPASIHRAVAALARPLHEPAAPPPAAARCAAHSRPLRPSRNPD